MKYIKYLIIIVLLLTSCSQETLEVKHKDNKLYTDIEVGVNYTEFTRQAYQDRADYETLYTHKVDYLMPLVFYYIPLNYNFDSKEKWQVYFEDWLEAVDQEDYSAIEVYVKNTSVEGYVKEKFNNKALMPILSLLIQENAINYVEGFESFYKTEWQEIQETLYNRANYLNEFLLSQRVAEKWQDKAGFTLDDFKISLSYYENEDLDKSSISYYKTVMYYMPELEVSEAVDVLSLEYGDNLIKTLLEPFIKEKIKAYGYLEEPVSKYLIDITDQIVLDYHAKLFKVYHEEHYHLPDLVTASMNSLDLLSYFEKASTWVLEDLKDEKVYIIDDQVHYKGMVYESYLVVKDTILYYKHQYPIVLVKDGEASVLTDSMDAYPELSSASHKMIFISPYAFEDVGSLYLYDFTEEKLEILVEKTYESSNTVKKCKWYDDHTILFIDGYAYGTITRGGNLNKYDLLTGQTEILISFEDSKKEVSDILYKDGKWLYEVTIFDENAINYALQYEELEMDAD
ncbi:DUF4652 domain-containing protein [Acidaminobacter sp. JC074]|uniref:DUF4652 domain-containing protein n=1 Tax=Acidaminobacter sp. JC074 TaxID=2530199 RepID=UPI001F100F9F|nr:DUF4652 domain-containing protein [Acidaminobacter sp. JC074]MCH4890537.1 DUF4652 domain-containing protein [Acidaminobacter sp. JC074]